jgi:hypothetical protein
MRIACQPWPKPRILVGPILGDQRLGRCDDGALRLRAFERHCVRSSTPVRHCGFGPTVGNIGACIRVNAHGDTLRLPPRAFRMVTVRRFHQRPRHRS